MLNSYAQIFFSKDKIFGLIILLVSFIDINAGIGGLLAIIIGQVTALLFNFNKQLIQDGTYTYNSALVGIAIGIFYQFNASFFVLLFIASVFVLFLSIWFLNTFTKKGLPFLSISFLLTIWLVILGANNFTALKLNTKTSVSLINYYPEIFKSISNFISSFPFSDAILIYFRSLGAILFQYNDLAGLLIAIGLLLYSRMGFVLSVFGFIIGYLFYYFLQGDFSQLIYSYIGFNFILTAIALGGFFVVASRRSFLLLLFTMPTIALLISGLDSVFRQFGLPIYSLPFNLVVWIFLMAMYSRTKESGLNLVKIQNFSIEKNHYKFFNYKERFLKENLYFPIALPVIGEWNISQSYNGNETHKGDWQHALDFVIEDENGKTYRGLGTDPKDYYCYDMPVVAPAGGYVVNILDNIDDNPIGEVNLENNWGNTIIIKHSDFLYSKLSHLKKNTFQVKLNDYVKKGDILAYVGNSGRSPEPHLHFQMQATPYIGSKTLEYPIGYYLTNNHKKFTFHSFDIPKKNEIVSNVVTQNLLINAYKFTPGKTIEYEVDFNGRQQIVKWEFFVDIYNKPYIYCHTSKSTAYFVNNGTLFYFTDFYGDKKSFLHYFYLVSHKILLGYYDDVIINDKVNVQAVFNKFLMAIHDFTASFFHYLKTFYQMRFNEIDNEHNPDKIIINTELNTKFSDKIINNYESEIIIEKEGIIEIRIKNKKKFIIAKLIK